MVEVGPGARALFEEAGTRLYEEALDANGLAVDDPRLQPGAELAEALALLLELGLLGREGNRYVAIDPTAAQSQVVSPLGQRGAELLAESSAWARTFGTLAHAWRRAPQPASGPVTEIRGDAIDPFIGAIVADAETELLTAQPQVGRNAAALAKAAERDSAALERGVRMRTLYQHAARRSSITHKYVATVTERGAEVRTLDEFFNRLIVVDRRLAIIPGREGHSVAIAIREPSLVAYLVDVFERHWERGRAFANNESSMLRDIAAEQRAMTIRMLIEGHADPVSAKRLGVSPRTYAGYVADLKEEFEAQTRFQLGYTMGQRGVSGHERPPTGR
ncbi:LuxR family transcriptional regulator [Nocardioides sp. ChNu-99]|uniref:LuxR family transcriptional regulator n=1 Tax=Nocardioides sp. ChNu-99 TaxID=2839897 RepID=UPI0024070579|nr:LuxR family transcriptional regulator [Nocardioides sp. ChNu-99]MDF9714910.1 LuxR family transcriptional regulator [Nocardioides sp. ChNu-99]